MGEWSYENEWFEETNVARKIKEYLERKGYKIIKFNENKRSKGHDIIAEKIHKSSVRTQISTPETFDENTDNKNKN
jgi:thymidylate kinase